MRKCKNPNAMDSCGTYKDDRCCIDCPRLETCSYPCDLFNEDEKICATSDMVESEG